MAITDNEVFNRNESGYAEGYSVPEYLDFIRQEGEGFASAAEGASLDVPIEPCPGWTMRDLVHHLGLIHLWAAANVAFPRPTWLQVSDLADLVPYWPDLAKSAPGDDELVDWYRATHRNLLDTLAAAPSDVQAHMFLPGSSPLTMWARRQSSEIAVHRLDAEQAAGIDTSYDPPFASDMLDELLTAFAPRLSKAYVDDERVLLVDADDVGDRWWVTMSPSNVDTSREGDRADLTVTGTAADLYLSLWNRVPTTGPQLDGETAVIDAWHETCRVRWS